MKENYYTLKKQDPVLLFEEFEDGSYYAFPITSIRNSLTINLPTISCAGKLNAVLVDRKIMVCPENIRAFYDRIDQQQLLNVLGYIQK